MWCNMIQDATRYRLRQAIFRLLLKGLSPVLPWLSRRPWAWRLKGALFRGGSDADWLDSYGSHWDAPENTEIRLLGLLADMRGAAPADQARLLADLDALSPSPVVTWTLVDGIRSGEILTGLGDLVLTPDAGLIHVTANCHPHRLLTAHYAAAMAAHPEVRLWYSDEVQTTSDGTVKVFCKPAWDPLYYASSGYVGQCFALRGDLAAAVLSTLLEKQTPDVAPPRSQEWFDLALELMAGNELIGHIPAPLHSLGSEHFPAPRPGHQTLASTAAQPLVSIIIPFKDRLDLLRPCLDTLLEGTDYPEFEIILVDNGSRDEEMLDFLNDPPDARIRVLAQNIPFNFSTLVNSGVSVAAGELVVLMNNDITIISPQWLNVMVDWAVRPPVGVVGAKLLYPNGLIQHGGIFLGVGSHLENGPMPPGAAHAGWPGDSDGYFGLLASPRVMSAVTGAVLAVRKDLYQELGGFDDELAVAMNDVDFCLKVRQKGLACVWAPDSILVHHESASRKMDRISAEKMCRLDAEWALMCSRWGEESLKTDPWYSPSLSPESSYELRSPPIKRLARLTPKMVIK